MWNVDKMGSSNVDEQLINWGVGYLQRRFPIVQMEKNETIRNVVSDLMFIGKYGRPVEDDAVIVSSTDVE